MKIKTIVFRIILSALALCAFMAGNAAMAQDQGSAAQNMPNPQVDSAACAQVKWAPQIMADYPRMPRACQEVVRVNGVNWVRFSAKLERMRNRSVLMNIQDPQGGSLGTFRMKPAADAKISIEGQEYSYWQIPKGHVLNFYIQEGNLVVASQPTEPQEEWSTIEPVPAVQVAESEPAEATPTSLPETAGPLPWFALAGIVFVFVGFGLTVSRRFS